MSGYAGGGNIYVGGNAHGAGPLPDANATVMLPGATLNASAINSGNGGNVVLWSNQNTQFYGSILAQGGLQSGNGGWVETSGGNLNFNGAVNTSAPNGLMGTLLLDPRFLVIQTSGGSNYVAGSNNLFANNIGATNILTPASIVAAVANVTLQANSDVVINNALALTSAGKTLTINAGRSVLINANLSTTNGAITITANDEYGNI